MAESSHDPQTRRGWAHPLAFVASLTTLVMILAGATVTTISAGDSDPEWSWHFWEWFRPAEGGLWYELLHRKIGTVLGFLVLALVIVLFCTDERRRVRRLGLVALALCVVQGLLGALRVKSVSGPDIQQIVMDLTGLDHRGAPMLVAMVHAAGAQALFCLLVALTLVTSRGWRRADAPDSELPPQTSPMAGKTRRLAVWTCVLLFVQLMLGAYVRHGRLLYPQESAPLFGAMTLAHVALALGVVGHVFLVHAHTRRHHPTLFPIWHLAGLAQFLSLVQLFLGLFAWIVTRSGEVAMPWDVAMLVRTLHVANGAMILAILVTLTLRSWRLLRPAAQPGPDLVVTGGREAAA